MSATLDVLLLEAMSLAEHDRADLATRLIASLDVDSDEDSAGVDAAWAAEIEDRITQVHAGEATIEWSVARRQILGKPDV